MSFAATLSQKHIMGEPRESGQGGLFGLPFALGRGGRLALRNRMLAYAFTAKAEAAMAANCFRGVPARWPNVRVDLV